MNWIDYTIIVIIAIGAVAGLRIGILGAVYYTIVVLVGWLAAAQLGSLVGEFLGSFLDNDRIVTVTSFGVVIGVVAYLGRILWPILKTVLGIGTLGVSVMVDRVGGLVVGLLLGVVISGAIVVGLTRLAYAIDDTPVPAGGDVAMTLDAALTQSTLTPMFASAVGALPAGSLGFAPAGFQTALDILEENIR